MINKELTDNSQKVYKEYLELLKEISDDDNEEKVALRQKKAIEFLSCICDDYLYKFDGDFIKIEMSEEWQR